MNLDVMKGEVFNVLQYAAGCVLECTVFFTMKKQII